MEYIIAYTIIIVATIGVFSFCEKVYNFYKDYKIRKDIEKWVQSLTEKDIKEIIKNDKQQRGE